MTEALGFMKLSRQDEGFLSQPIGVSQTHADSTPAAIDSVAAARLLDNVPKWRREGNGNGLIHPATRVLEPGAVA
jgi:hypothetical protein